MTAFALAFLLGALAAWAIRGIRRQVAKRRALARLAAEKIARAKQSDAYFRERYGADSARAKQEAEWIGKLRNGGAL